MQLIKYCFIFLFSFSVYAQNEIIELPLSKEIGYGYFKPSFRGINTYPAEKTGRPLEKTQLNLSGPPSNWGNIKYGDIETNIYQTVYQAYLEEKISQKDFDQMKKAWDWKLDSSELSESAIKTKIGFATGTDSSGNLKMIIDANNNLTLTDDKAFEPLNHDSIKDYNQDSIALKNSIPITFEQFINNKVQEVTLPYFVKHISKYDILVGNFPQYSKTTFEGNEIVVCSDNFTNLLYKNPSIATIDSTVNKDSKIDNQKLIEKNEYIKINGKLYKNMGVSLANNTLKLEAIDEDKNELFSTQRGFRPPPFNARKFKSDTTISLKNLEGKYVLIDFWAVWCQPCIAELPNLKQLYEKTNRNDFEIISIVGESKFQNLEKAIEKFSINWPHIFSDEDNQLVEKYKINGYPTTFLLNKEGYIIAKDIRGEELKEKVLELID